MFFVAALLAFAPLLFLSVSAQYIILNTATGLVFEDHDAKPLEYGNPIAGAIFDPSPLAFSQSWNIGHSAGRSVILSSGRLLGPSQTISAGVDGPLEPGAELTAQPTGTRFFTFKPFGVGPIIAFVVAFGSDLAITAPTVANGTLTLQPFNVTNLHQHWIPVGDDYAAGSSASGKLPDLPVATRVAETKEA